MHFSPKFLYCRKNQSVVLWTCSDRSPLNLISEVPPWWGSSPSMRDNWLDLLKLTQLSFDAWLHKKQQKLSHEEPTSLGNETVTAKTLQANSKASRNGTKENKNIAYLFSWNLVKAWFVSKGRHTVWRCAVFKMKTRTQRAPLIVENLFCKNQFREHRSLIESKHRFCNWTNSKNYCGWLFK